MPLRLNIIICSVAAAFGPSLCVLRAADHADEHAGAATGSAGHSHYDGHTPHHNHGPIDDPIPLSNDACFCVILVTPSGPIPVPDLLPAAIGDALLDSKDAGAQELWHACFGQIRASHEPPVRGDTLPLLI